MGMFKVYVGNLDRKATADDVRGLFVAFPDVEDIALATDKEGASRCFAIVMFRDKQRGLLAIDVLKDKKLHGRPLVINEVQKKPKAGEAAKPQARGPFGPRGPGGMGGSSRGPGGPRGLGGAPRSGPSGRGFGGSSRGPAGPRGLGGQSESRPSSGFSRNPRRGPASGGAGGRGPGASGPGAGGPGAGPSRFGSRPAGDRGPLGPRAGGSGTTGPSAGRPDATRPPQQARPEDKTGTDRPANPPGDTTD